MPGPLDGYRVIDCSAMLSGPLATRILADQGADVVKVEPPGHGDLVRGIGARSGGMAAIFATTNRSKRSIAIDLKTETGLGLLRRLVAGADVFVQNFRPGAAERMGIGESALRAEREDLVYVSISGFGETGPYAHKRVYDPVIQALSGLADVQRDRDTGRPRMVRTVLPDKLTALTAAQAITAALLARERSGRGQHLRLAMLDAMVAFLWPEGMTAYTWMGRDVKQPRSSIAQDLIFETADGYLTCGAVSEAEWRGLVRALEQPHWLDDARFATPTDRVVNAGERFVAMADVLRERTSAEWLARLEAEQVPCAPVLSRREVLTHPQVLENGIVVESEHPHVGPLRQARPPERFDATPSEIRSPAPMLGEHTDDILGELGLPDAEIGALRDTGVVA